MELVDIIQIIIGFLTLIATIAVSFSIYWLQMRHEKEVLKLELERRAEQFLFDNEDEREYLPLCVFANNLHRHEKHTRKIYTNFCRCSEEMQNEILVQAGFTIGTITNTKWVVKYLNFLEEDIKKYNLGKDVLYGNAKYFHRGFERYKSENYDIYIEHDFERIYKLTETGSRIGISNYYSIEYYFHDYFDVATGNAKPEQLNNQNPTPPIDLIVKYFDWASCDEMTACIWTIFIVKNIAKNIFYLENHNYNVIFETIIELDIETIEDAYYEALFWLYVAYHNKKF